MLDEQGLEGLTLRAIARRAGLSHGAPLRHFPTLASLLAAVGAQGFRELMRRGRRADRRASADGASALEHLAAAGRGYVTFAIASPGVFTVMFRPERLDSTDPVYVAASLESFRQLQDIVEAAQAEGFHPDVDVTPARVRDVDDDARPRRPLDPRRRAPRRRRDLRARRLHRALAIDRARHRRRARHDLSKEERHARPEHNYLEGNFGPVHEEITAIDLPVTGTVPAELDGRFLRNGPNPISAPDPEKYHWFTGDGMVHGLRLRDGKAEWYRNRWVRSPEVAAALGEPAPPSPFAEGTPTFGANTNVVSIAGKTFAIVEAGVAAGRAHRRAGDGRPVELRRHARAPVQRAPEARPADR